MYEHLSEGLGWSELTWWEKTRMLGIACNVDQPGKPRSVCFENNPQDEQVAHLSRCVRYPGGACERGTRAGSIWCCPEGYPREYMRDIPSDVLSYEEERLRQLELEQAGQTPQETTPVLPSGGDPRPVVQHTFLSRLTHPGAIAALGILASGGVAFYLIQKRRARRDA